MVAFGGAESFAKAQPVCLPGGRIVCNRLAASRSHRRVTISTARRGGLPFVPAKGSKTGSRGTDSPLTNPFLSLAVLDTDDAKHRPYCAQIRSQGSRGRICPTPSPSPVAGEGPSGQIAACSTHRLDSVTSCNRFAGTKLKCACGSLSASSNPAPGMRSVSGREGSDA